MYINEYGDSSLPKIILLHPMELTGTELYERFAAHLKEEYCVIAPDQGGHGRSGPYISLKDELTVLKGYLLEKGYTKIRLLYGASMGAAAAYELLKDPAFYFEGVWLDGGAFAKKAPFMNWMMRTMFLRKARQLKRNPAAPARRLASLYGEETADMMKQNFMRLSTDDIIRICEVCSFRVLEELPTELQKNIHIEWGEADPDYRISRRALPAYFPQAEVVIRKSYGHCGYMTFHTKEYVEEMERFCRSKEGG